MIASKSFLTRTNTIFAVGIVVTASVACTAPPIGSEPRPSSNAEGSPRDPSSPAADARGDGSASAPPPLTLMAQAMCDHDFRCDQFHPRVIWGTVANCLQGRLDDLRETMTLRDVSLPDAQVAKCAAAWTAASCADLSEGGPDCVFKGPRAKGAPCQTSKQCQSGACEWQRSRSCAVCVDPPVRLPPAEENESCADKACAAGLICDSGTATCVRQLTTLGADCSNAICYDVAGLQCDYDASSPTHNQCIAIRWAQLGEPCGPHAGFCIGAMCTGDAETTGTCVPYADEGGACRDFTDCKGDRFICVDGKCQQPVLPDSCK